MGVRVVATQWLFSSSLSALLTAAIKSTSNYSRTAVAASVQGVAEWGHRSGTRSNSRMRSSK